MQSLLAIFAVALLSGGVGTSPAPSKVTSNSGPEVYLYGNMIKSPYTVELVGTTVQLNRVQVYPLLSDSKRPAIEPTPEQVERHEFLAEGVELQRRMEQGGKCCGEVAAALAEHYRARTDLVADVWGLNGNSFWVRWKDGSEEEIVVASGVKSSSAEERARSELAQIQKALNSRCILIIGSIGSVTVPPDDPKRVQEVRAEIARARTTPVTNFGTESKKYSDGRWQGKYLPTDIARQFARPLQLTPRQED